jgi:hypothetical protein
MALVIKLVLFAAMVCALLPTVGSVYAGRPFRPRRIRRNTRGAAGLRCSPRGGVPG